MNASISIIYYKFRTNKSGAHPLMLRIIKNRKTNYQSLGIYIHPDHWDFKKNKPKKNCPNGIAIQRLITEKIKEYTDKAIDLEIEKKDFTGKTLIDKVNTPVGKFTQSSPLNSQ